MDSKRCKTVLSWIMIWLLLSVAIASVTQWLFSFHAPFDWMIAKWTPGEALTFLAATAAAVSTVALGRISIMQTQETLNLQKESEQNLTEERLKNDEQQIIDSQRPFLIIDNVLYDDENEVTQNNGSYYLGMPTFEPQPKGVWLVLGNYGQGVANHVMLERRVHGAFGNPSKSDVLLACVPAGGQARVYFPYHLYKSDDSFTIYYENILGAVYSQSFRYEVKHEAIFNEETGAPEREWMRGIVRQLSSQRVIGLKGGYDESSGTYTCDESD